MRRQKLFDSVCYDLPEVFRQIASAVVDFPFRERVLITGFFLFCLVPHLPGSIVDLLYLTAQ